MNGRNPTPWTAPRTLTFRRSKFIACTDFGVEPLAAPRALLSGAPGYVSEGSSLCLGSRATEAKAGAFAYISLAPARATPLQDFFSTQGASAELTLTSRQICSTGHRPTDFPRHRHFHHVVPNQERKWIEMDIRIVRTASGLPHVVLMPKTTSQQASVESAGVQRHIASRAVVSVGVKAPIYSANNQPQCPSSDRHPRFVTKLQRVIDYYPIRRRALRFRSDSRFRALRGRSLNLKAY